MPVVQMVSRLSVRDHLNSVTICIHRPVCYWNKSRRNCVFPSLLRISSHISSVHNTVVRYFKSAVHWQCAVLACVLVCWTDMKMTKYSFSYPFAPVIVLVDHHHHHCHLLIFLVREHSFKQMTYQKWVLISTFMWRGYETQSLGCSYCHDQVHLKI